MGEGIMNRQSLGRSTQFSRRVIATAAVAAAAQFTPLLSRTAHAQQVTISTSGSTALKNWFVKKSTTFTDIQPGTTINIGGTTYPTDGTSEWEQNGGPAYAYQLAPKANSSAAPTQGTTLDSANALQFEYHESGSVEGILEMANDQIAPVTYVTQNINRDPNTGNAVWINYNQFGGGGTAANPTNYTTNAGGSNVGTGTVNGFTLGEFYANGQQFVLGGNAQPAFNRSGGNLNGGQNAVQLAVSDAIPLQVFAANNTSTTSSTPWTLTPQNAGYGQGNTALPTAGLGTSSLRAVYQSTAALNMSAGAINPRTGTAFGTGPWNSAGLGNLNSQLAAVTATLFVANPGTGLTQVDRTDAQWLQTTGRLQNGASFNMTTRDVNSGTRNVAALETGIDPTWAVGVNDDGNGNAANGGTNQVTIGSGLRFSNKTAGGNELRPTVESARMSVGTLAITDAAGYTLSTNSNPVRALAYSDSTDGSAPYVTANYNTISTGQYTIFQNEQFVTLKAPDSSYSTASPNVQGDDSTGDVKSLIANTTNSVATYLNDNATAASPAAGLLSQGYILPQLMQVEKAQNGLNQPGLPSQIVSNAGTGLTNYNSSLATGTAYQTMVSTNNMGVASTVTSGVGSLYGADSLSSASPAGFVSPIAITNANYLFGNFNQNGVRDFSAAVVAAQQAQAALQASGYGNSAFSGNVSTSVVTTGIAALDAMPSQNGQTSTSNTSGTGATKGDLIVMGDYNGDGVFDGRDLYDMAIGASLSDPNNRPVLIGSGASTTVKAGTGTITVPAGENFGQVIASSVLNKNVALDYLQAVATASEKQQARAVLTSTTGTTATSIPAGSTFVGYEPTNGFAQFTYDPTGANAFNKSDVNGDGVVDFNDALAVDALNGDSYTNQANSLTATEPTPVTGAPELANLVLAQQIDTKTAIGASDLAVVSAALTGVGTTNWYAYTAAKTGPGTITWNRTTGSTVNLYTGASLNISAGTLQVITSGVDPFTDNNANAPASLNDTSKSLAVTVTAGTLEYTSAGTTIQLDRLSSLNISGGSVILAPVSNHAGRSVLELGSLNVSGTGKLDLGNNDAIVKGGNLAALNGLVKIGYAGGAWNGSGISSSSAASDSGHLTAVGVIQNSVDGTPTGAALYGSGTSLGLFDGISPASADVLVKYTYYGDTNLDGKVDGSDYAKIDYAYAHPALTGWANGDFNYDGVVDGSDYALIDNAFNSQGAVLTASIAAQVSGTSAVPEPASLGLLAVTIGGLLGRRRRQA
jgi:hypothetical protein